MSDKPTNTEQKILEAAKEVFIKNGLNGARMQDIADVAGINKALLHYYFRSKEILFDKIFEEAFFKYISTMDTWNVEGVSFKEKLFRYVDSYVDFLTGFPLVPLFIIKEVSANPGLFKEKVLARKLGKNSPKLIDLIRKELPKLGRDIDPEIFWVNLQSLCTYPFIGGPIFKMGMKLSDKEWNEIKTKNLKSSVKHFISMCIG